MLLTLAYGVALIIFMIAGNAVRLSLVLRHFRDEERKNLARAGDRCVYPRALKAHPTAS
jgi:hypothetical protein